MSNLVGKPVSRVDGRQKVTGAARYSADFPLENLTYGVFVTSAIANGRIASIDTKAAEQAPGVLAVLTHLNTPQLAQQPKGGFGVVQVSQSFSPMQAPEIYYSGQQIAIVIANTLEQATHAAKLVQVTYQQQQPVTMKDLDKTYEPKSVMMGMVPGQTVRGNVEQALAQAEARIEATYTIAANHHNPLEPSATIADWQGDKLTLYDATQGVYFTRSTVANLLGIPIDNVRVISQFVGGGFGCKGTVWSHTWLAALAAQKVGRPVKLVLTREQMYTAVGHREEQAIQFALGATRDGKLTAIKQVKTSPTSPFDDWAEPNGGIINHMYACDNFDASYRLIKANVMTPTFTRAPGEVPGMFVLESALDELAYKLGIDPIELRLRNHADVEPGTGKPYSSKSLKQCYARGAELIGWQQRQPQPQSMRDGRWLIGYGMASSAFPVYRPGTVQTARAKLLSNGRAVVQCGAADIGTGTYTILAQVAAEVLGLSPESILVEIGDTTLPVVTFAGGSQGAGAWSSAVHVAATALRQKLMQLAIADPKSPLHQAQLENLAVENGRLFLKQNRDRSESYTQLLSRSKQPAVEAIGKWQVGAKPGVDTGEVAQEDVKAKYAMQTFGAQFAQVRVDPDLGIVRVVKCVGVFGAGRILNPKTARSQLMGGIVWGIGQALLEHTHMDSNLGRYTNANFAEYLVPVNADIPEIEIDFVEEVDKHINVLGVKGVGEIGMVGANAAIANAVFHATGKRIRDLPITPDKLL
jgi:xanthine dehydrogenase YagR molybdenum-binding subunit